MILKPEYEESCKSWIRGQWDALPEEIKQYSPSEYAEEFRYLPVGKTAMPGRFSFDATPYTREILDNADPRSPIQYVAWLKGAQTSGTVGVLENCILYDIGYLKTAASGFVTETQDLASLRFEGNILPMIQQSDHAHLIRSEDDGNKRKTGQTNKKISWLGGGSLLPVGAKSVSKMVSLSWERLYRDEVSKWPASIAGHGSPLKLTEDRTLAFELTKMIYDVSTPGTKGQCHIEAQYKRGDQRKYNVPCVECGGLQELRWSGIDTDTGLVYGIHWEQDETGKLVEGSVRYICRFCGHKHTNADKTRMFPDAVMGGRAKWVPTAVPEMKNMRSYHLPGLYAATFMSSWESNVRDYLEAYDPIKKKVKDIEKYKRFYNSILGETFANYGERLKFNIVSKHRRSYYKYGEIPNLSASQHSGGPASFVITTVDVHGNNLAVATWAVSAGTRLHLIDYERLVGNPKQANDPDTWGKLAEMIDSKTYLADDMRSYRIALTLVDGSYQKNIVSTFCNQWDGGVVMILGRKEAIKTSTTLEFSAAKSAIGTKSFYVTVDMYKTSWSEALKLDWDGVTEQPERFLNVPSNTSDKQLKELTAEYKVDVKSTDGRVVGTEWKRPSGADNELWDLLMYANAGVDMIAVGVCDDLGLKTVNWAEFWDYIENEQLFFNIG